MRIDPSIGAEGQRNAQPDRLGESLPLGVGRFQILAQIFGRPMVAGADLVDPVPIVNVHVEPDAAGLGEPQELFGFKEEEAATEAA